MSANYVQHTGGTTYSRAETAAHLEREAKRLRKEAKRIARDRRHRNEIKREALANLRVLASDQTVPTAVRLEATLELLKRADKPGA